MRAPMTRRLFDGSFDGISRAAKRAAYYDYGDNAQD